MLPDVRRWFGTHTFHSDEWSVDALLVAKGQQRVSVVLPARNEQRTLGGIVGTIHSDLVDHVGLVDEVVVMDSRSTDATAQLARKSGAKVFAVDEVLPWLGPRDGKGEALWKSLAVTTGDIVVFLDADLIEFSTHYVTGLLGPLLTQPGISFVKAAYERPLTFGTHGALTGGGRVTEFAARPVLNAYWPELAGFLQPLAGEYAARREALERVPFVCGYGVEVGLLIDLLQDDGLFALAQVDLGHRRHRNRGDAELVAMASAVLQAAARRLPGAQPISTTITQFQRNDHAYVPTTVDVLDDERPPYATLQPLLRPLLVS